VRQVQPLGSIDSWCIFLARILPEFVISHGVIKGDGVDFEIGEGKECSENMVGFKRLIS